MKKLSTAAVLGILIMVVFALPTTATAATEFGDNCVANSAVKGYTFVQLQNAPGSPLSVSAPTGGVITKWKVSVIPFSGSIPETLKLLRPTGATNQFQVVTESAPGTVVSGANAFETRIPVQPGDRIGVTASGEIGVLYCLTGNSENLMGAFLGNATVGSTPTFSPTAGLQAAVSAVIEPDADNDGYGDETQDKCPQSASTQSECPTITLDLSSAVKKKGSVVVPVTATSEALVAVAGTVSLGKGKKAKLSGGKHTVKPGAITRFTLKFPKKLKAALSDLPKSQSLKLKVTASATDLIGRVSKDQLKVKLKGQG